MRHCGISQQVITDVEIEVVFGSIDVDGGGDISGEELVAFISGLKRPAIYYESCAYI